ncbi:MAG: hypothetical protein ABGX04_08885 [Myxococcales bacterium]
MLHFKDLAHTMHGDRNLFEGQEEIFVGPPDVRDGLEDHSENVSCDQCHNEAVDESAERIVWSTNLHDFERPFANT